MFELLSILPISFWVVIVLLVGGGVWAFSQMNDGTGLPLLAVLGTTAAWYVGDAFYNDYANNHARLFDAATLQNCWLQVAWFIVVLLMVTPAIHRWVNRDCLRRHSGVLQLFTHGVGYPVIQKQLNMLFAGCVLVWSVLFVIALVLLKGQIIYYLFPFMGYKVSPWVHGRIGAGFDALSIVAVYMQLLAASMFGVVTALATTPKIRSYAVIFCLLSWPFFIFDRTRNTMLAMVVPAVLSWVFLRIRGRMWRKALILLAIFCAINVWMKFVIANRSEMSITAAFKEKGLNLGGEEKVHNEGLNMFEELCWISTFLDKGTYHVNWGKRYFAEVVNPIPRGLWSGKPLIGIDYAIARGQGGADKESAGVYATISTGMVGQGVVNFGRFFGPAAAALLMGLWVAWLARLDLNIQALGHLPLYSLGLILTFNLGRDITLITLYPFIFGAIVVWWLGRRLQSVSPQTVSNVPATKSYAPPKQNSNYVRVKGFSFAQKSFKAGLMKRTTSGMIKRNSRTNQSSGSAVPGSKPDGS